MTTIAEHILSSTFPGAQVSAIDDFDNFFEDFPNHNEEDWPLMGNDNKKPMYFRALVGQDILGIEKKLSVEAFYETENEAYTIVENMSTDDDKLEIELLSVVRESKRQQERQKDNFIYHLLEKHRQFMVNFVRKRHVDPEDVFLTIRAHSGHVGDVPTRGGYVWATYGFDFDRVSDLDDARVAFKSFASEHGVEIRLKDLVHFKHPCHFAAFRTSQNVDGQPLGRAFLMQYSWLGKMLSNTNKKSELYRYQKSYHENGKNIAEKELSKSFLKMMSRYNQDAPKKTVFHLFPLRKKVER